MFVVRVKNSTFDTRSINECVGFWPLSLFTSHYTGLVNLKWIMRFFCSFSYGLMNFKA